MDEKEDWMGKIDRDEFSLESFEEYLKSACFNEDVKAALREAVAVRRGGRMLREAKKRLDEMNARGKHILDPFKYAEGASKLIEALKIIENNMKYSFFVGLFCFKEDYSDIDRIADGVRFFTDEDIAAKKTILPEGSLSTYKARLKKLPGGRVELNEGVVTITVGEKCPESAIDIIIRNMCLEPYKEGIRVIRASYWDEL